MKKIIVMVVLLIISCTTAQDLTPREVASKYLKAIAKKDFKTALKYSTKQEIEDVKFALEFINFEAIENYELTILKDSINGNICWVKYDDDMTKEVKMKYSILKLEKLENQWKVVSPKPDEKSFFIETIKFPTRKPIQ